MRRQLRVPLIWTGFVVTSLAIGFAVHHLYQTARQEIVSQREQALKQEMARVNAEAERVAGAEHRSFIGALAGMHVDGLGPTLRRWGESESSVVGVFQWEEEGGFSFEPKQSPLPWTPANLEQLRKEFGDWRQKHPTALNGHRGEGGQETGAYYSTRNNPWLAGQSLGYQDENLDILAHDGKAVDPWGGWAAEASSSTWVFWYQAGPTAPVRGCFVDAERIVRKVSGELADTALARMEIVRGAARASGAPALGEAAPLAGFPGYLLVATPGSVFDEKESRAGWSVLVVGLLFGVFLMGAGFLTMYTLRETRDATRKTTFVSQVSHELRTPLTSIRMFADMLAAPGLAEEKRARFAGHISRESERLGTLIERLLAFNALEAGKQKVTMQLVDVAQLVGESTERMQAPLLAAAMRADVHLPPAPVEVTTDPIALRQALLNLIDNAVKYAGRGVVRIEVTSDRREIRVRVADEGPGVPAAVRDTLFEPFVQGGTRLTDKSPGVGLGLSIARGMLRQAGGDLVLLQSETGAVFEIRLPVATAGTLSTP